MDPLTYSYGVIKCCLDCRDRHLGCHGKCMKYLKEKAKLDILRKRISDDRDAKYHTNKNTPIPKRDYIREE